MTSWIRFAHRDVPPPQPVSWLSDAIAARVPRIAEAVATDGGLRKRGLLEALAPEELETRWRAVTPGTFGSTVLDLVDPRGLALSVQTGRAKTNNDWLLAVLAAAAQPEVRWLVLVVPDEYKGSATADPIDRGLKTLAAAEAIKLELDGVLLLSFDGRGARAPGTREPRHQRQL